jgi:hypothetical protein
MRGLITSAFVAALLIANVKAADAQWVDRARISINVGTQPSSTTFVSTTNPVIYQETASINTTYTVPSGTLFDGGFLVRLAGNFGVGVALASYAKSKDASVAGSIPHPFFFNTPRSISGTAGSLQRKELAAHIQAAYVIAAGRFDVVLSGGPSFFDVSQDLVSGVSFTETYPYDTATFGTASTTRATGTKVGYNAGVDIGVMLARNVGVGVLFRFSRATLTLPLSPTPAATPPLPDSSVTVDTGGPQLAGGLRFYF